MVDWVLKDAVQSTLARYLLSQCSFALSALRFCFGFRLEERSSQANTLEDLRVSTFVWMSLARIKCRKDICNTFIYNTFIYIYNSRIYIRDGLVDQLKRILFETSSTLDRVAPVRSSGDTLFALLPCLHSSAVPARTTHRSG